MTFHGEQSLDDAAEHMKQKNMTIDEEPGKQQLLSDEESPAYAGPATFLRTPYETDRDNLEGVDVAFLGIPFDVGTSFRPGTRFGPEALREISKLYQTYSFEDGIDLAEELNMVDIGDLNSVHAIDKQIERAQKSTYHLVKQGVFPVVMGGDHSIAIGTIAGAAEAVDGKVGVIHLDRHLDMSPYTMEEKMHDTPFYHVGNLESVDTKNMVHIGIGGWLNDAEQAAITKERGQTVFTVKDVAEHGVEAIAEAALEKAWADGVEAVYLTVDIDVVDSNLSIGTGTPEPGGLLSREVLELVRKLAEPGLIGMELVEVSPPYDTSNQSALMGTRIICDVLASLAKNKQLPLHQ